MNSDVTEGQAVCAPLMAPVVSLLSDSCDMEIEWMNEYALDVLYEDLTLCGHF